MRLWRLSSTRHARDFSGGYGLVSSGRWNSIGQRVTYCSTVPSLCALEKRAHYRNPDLLPSQSLVEYEVPDGIAKGEIRLGELPFDWVRRETHTQKLGDEWLARRAGALLIVPSAIVSVASAPDRNILVNHEHQDVGQIMIIDVRPFALDPRLFA